MVNIEEAGTHPLNAIAAVFHEHPDETPYFYNHRSSNATAESSSAEIKLFRAGLRGVADKSALPNYMHIPAENLQG